MGKGEVHTGYCFGYFRAGEHLEDPSVVGRIILKWNLKTWNGAWTGLIWLRIGTGDGLL
jgi:hypothetical protein